MHRIVFMGTPEFAVPSLQALLATQEVVGVVTQPDRPAGRGRQIRPSPVKVVAETAGIPLYQPCSLRQPEAAEPLRAWQPDAIVVVAYGQILRPHVLALPPLGCLNVHASLLPRWRGAAPIQHAILAGDQETGVSLMQMDEGMDTGPVFVQRSIPIGPQETAATLHDRLAALGAQVLTEDLGDVLAGRIDAPVQDDAQATYAPLIKKEHGQLDWTQDSSYLGRHVRALTPWPSAHTNWQGKQLKVLSARPVAAADLPTGDPGQVVAIGEGATVLTGDGGLQLLEVQLAGKRATAMADFLRGRPDFIGSRLGA